MNRNDREFIVQKIRTQYMGKMIPARSLIHCVSLTLRQSVLRIYSDMFSAAWELLLWAQE